ncbi:MAG: hypothetical protein HY367_00140 [Candidatus Aenigmarchaeota archaeon]|nr:hypothetical protein [Candidatus Aenigmarchaeota archaeon]
MEHNFEPEGDIKQRLSSLTSEIHMPTNNYFDKLFWVLFIMAGIALAFAAAAAPTLAEIILGILVVALGVQKIGGESRNKSLKVRHRRIEEQLNYVSHLLNSSHYFTKQIKDMHESRFLRVESKRIDMEKRIQSAERGLERMVISVDNKVQARGRELERSMEREYRDIARKIIEVENRIGRLERNLERLK